MSINFQMESRFCSAAQVFFYANESNGDATTAVDDVFKLVVEFLYELHFWQQSELRLLAQAHGMKGLAFSPAT